MCAQQRNRPEIRPVWSVFAEFGPLTIHLAHSEDSDQTGRTDLSLR